MLEALFQVLAAGLHVWESKEKTKYVDRLLKLKKDWYEEFSKPSNLRDDDVLARIELELRNLASEWSAIVSAQAS